MEVIKKPPERRRPVLSRMLIEAPTSSDEIEQAQARRLRDDVLHRPRSQQRREIQERPGDRGGGYAVNERRVPGAERPHAMQAKLLGIGGCARSRRLRHVNQPTSGRHQPPVRGRVAVAQDGPATARPHGCEPLTFAPQLGVTDGVDAAVEHTQPALRNPIGDPRTPQAASEEMAARDDAPMVVRDRGDGTVHVGFDVHMTL
ncbi:MAG TPA: hypothetical protein VGO71_21320 [Baekduia sp.]|nr:hypothetical protein [Baekduia sp.]